MCRMMAVVGDVALQTKALRAFHRLAECGQVRCGMTPGHMDGWGIAAYGEHGAAYAARSAGSVVAEADAYSHTIGDVVQWRSPIVIAHFRKASQGSIHLENTHPFIDPPWIFCHNGTVYGLDILGPRSSMAATSDTAELLVRWRGALDAVPARPVHPIVHFQEWIAGVEQQCRFTSLTCLLTNGKELLARRRVGPSQPGADDPNQYYTLYHWHSGDEHVICSEALSELPGRWRLLNDGENFTIPLLADVVGDQRSGYDLFI